MQDSIPSFKQLVSEWEAYCVLADRKQSQYNTANKYTGRRVRELWETVDCSLPITLSNSIWYVRIQDHKVKGLLLDIRRFEHKSNGEAEWYEPTEEGLSLPIGWWIKLLDPIFKLLKKWRDK